MVQVEFLTIFTSQNKLIYSSCFSKTCRYFLEEQDALVELLQTHDTFRTYHAPLTTEQDTNGSIKQSLDKKYHFVQTDQMDVIYFYTRYEGVVIAIGITPHDIDNSFLQRLLVNFLSSIEDAIERHYTDQFESLSTTQLQHMEGDILSLVISSFFKRHEIKNNCDLGEQCLFRQATYEGEGEKLSEKVISMIRQYDSQSTFEKLRKMIGNKSYYTPIISKK